ncbi:MFS transporter [Bartonella krasnovii]|uniref:MFS transporter n=1 Tax=Bartonella krasnovii TaxID=2267275 RepID=UPI001F4CADEF|nr:MFS transporter [Bartonella krasnovii]UNF45558.1 MFS transporter [Bartonella krasnovii]UNF47143.1 MFS transporter [Bartonella krasnovii]UNF52152.1 MFS transporter [Bartonella krasnovii]
MFIANLKECAALFENKIFLYFTLSSLFATFGNGLNYIALSWLAYSQTNSIRGVALLMFFLWMPSIIFAPILGILADKYNRKTQIIISNLARGLVIMGWVMLGYFGIEIDLMILSASLGIFISFYMPSAVPLIQSIVPKKQLINANATIDMVYELGTIIGMGFSGFILACVGTKGTLLIGGIFFIIAGLFNFAMRVPKNRRAKNQSKQNWWENYTESLHYFKQNSFLFMPYVSQMIITTLLMTIPVILVPYTQEVLSTDSGTFAIFEGLYSMGVLTGALLSPLLCKVLSIRRTLAFLLAVMAIGLAILSVNTHIFVVFPVYFMIGFGLSSWALSISLSQLSCDPEYQGRLQASFNGLSGCFILGVYLIMANDSSSISPQSIYFLQSIVALVGVFIVLFYKHKKH